MDYIAHIENDYETKFGIPRQAGLVQAPLSRIVFEIPYRSVDAVRGLDGFSFLWIIWDFSEVRKRDGNFSPTVRPPRLGGNERMGVFATRSPYRPNPIGLSSVEIAHIDLKAKDAPVIYVKGADLMNGTPIYDIKPYLPYTDAHPEAKAGFTDETARKMLHVEIPAEAEKQLGRALTEEVRQILAQDPRPAYQHNPDRIYGLAYAGWNIRFKVQDDMLMVIEIIKGEEKQHV